jgi:hypothetical protein
MDRRALEQLTAAAVLRDGTAPSLNASPAWASAAPAIGLDEQGVPFSGDGQLAEGTM